MRSYVIMTDSSCDLPSTQIKEKQVHVVPLGVTVGDKSFMQYPDYREMGHKEFYAALREGASGSTAGTNIQHASDMMTKIVQSGHDIIYLSLSSGLSCSYQNACLAAEDVMENYPDAKIAVIDTQNVSVGLGLLVTKAIEYKEQGMDFQTILNNLYDHCENMRVQFVVEDLTALSRSGRISHFTASVGSMLNIKPLLRIEQGKIQNFGKARGRKAAMKQLTNDMIMSAQNTTTFVIGHVDAADEAMSVKEMVLKAYPNSNIIVTEIGPVVAIHTGMKTVAFAHL